MLTLSESTNIFLNYSPWFVILLVMGLVELAVTFQYEYKLMGSNWHASANEECDDNFLSWGTDSVERY